MMFVVSKSAFDLEQVDGQTRLQRERISLIKKSPNANCIWTQRGGSGWIRTTEAKMQQIYSLPPLATREHSHMFRARSVSARVL